jgi:hypothetical protein
LLHHICVSQIINDDVHQGPKAISGDKDIHSSLGVAREKVGDFVNMCSILQSNTCDSILKCIMGYYMFIPIGAPKQMGTYIVNGMTILTPWKMGNHRMWQVEMGTWCYKKVGWRFFFKCKCGRTINNQVPTPRPTHEWKRAHMMFERTSTKNETNFYLCRWSTKKTCNLG